VVDELAPLGQATILSLDRVLACLNPEEQQVQRPVEVNIQPPKIFYSPKAACLSCSWASRSYSRWTRTSRSDVRDQHELGRVLRYDRVSLLSAQWASWLSTADPVKGPWTGVKKLPAALSSLPADDNWADVRKNVPGKSAKNVPIVFVTTEPAELILTKGEPSYSPIPGTRLMRVANTESVLFLHSGEGQYYFLTAGRWFRTKTLDGPWSRPVPTYPRTSPRFPTTMHRRS